jgi:hypothetical protein
MKEVWVVIGTDSGSDQTWIEGIYSSQSQADYASAQPEATRHGGAYWEKWDVQ